MNAGGSDGSAGADFDSTRDLDAPFSASRGEPLLGEIAVEWKLVDRTALAACLSEQAVARARGEAPPELGALLVARGLLPAEQLPRLLKEQERRCSAFPRFARYELRGLVGEGATAFIYRAWDRELARAVAVKVLKDGHVSDVARARFRREAQAAAGLAHPNVVAVYDAGEEGGRLFLVMELVEGEPLVRALRDPRRDLRKAVALLEKAARGVAAAHAKGVVHRDLKPANILVAADGRPKVGDFGLARLVDSTTELTRTGATLGTPLYMAPEQVNAHPDEIGPRTDVYALGAMLYEALVGRPPHVGETVGQIYARIAGDEVVPPRVLAADTPSELETVALKALDREPARRYASADEFADELLRWLEGEPVRARPVATAVRLWRKAVRHRRVLLPLAGLVAAGLALGSWAVVASRVHAREREALRRLDAARPALDAAAAYLYVRDARREELLRRVDAAGAIIDEALADAPGLAVGHYLRARTLEIRGEEASSEEELRRALSLDPAYGPAHYLLGRLLLERAYLAGTGATQEELDANRPQAERLAREAAGHVEKAMATAVGFDDHLQREVARGLLAYLRRDYAGVLAAARQGISRFGEGQGGEEFHWLEGLALAGPEQLRAFDRAVARRPQYPLALFSRAVARFGAGDLRGAVEDYDEVLRLRPSNARAWHNRGVARSLLGDDVGGLADLDRAIALDPGYAMGFYNRAVTHASRQALAEARRDYDRAIALDPRHAEAFNNRGVLRARGGDLAGAVEDYDRALALRPGYAAAYQNRGLAKARRGDLAGATADYGEALRIEPRLVEAAYNRACARFIEGDAETAAEDFRRVLRDAPTDWPRRADAEASLALSERTMVLDDGPSPGRGDLRRAERAIRLGHVDVALPLYERGLAAADLQPLERARAAYNLACCHVVTSLQRADADRGRLLDRALDRLEEVERLGALDVPENCCDGRHGSLRAHARDDEDLAPLRSHPRFRKIVGKARE